ncbi:TPA: glycosyltransferase family 1 protein, partial [Candidatus Woesearchaeota archaeon]|nr:glycosyltransferase family 1 protein [Candidatus Woesearchaeota archaeon]
MPSSSHYQISKIMNLVVKLNPSSILDVGVGFGKYGVLCREYLELGDGREEYDKFLRRIDGIEAFKNYITPLHRFIYDHIYIGDGVNPCKF